MKYIYDVENKQTIDGHSESGRIVSELALINTSIIQQRYIEMRRAFAGVNTF